MITEGWSKMKFRIVKHKQTLQLRRHDKSYPIPNQSWFPAVVICDSDSYDIATIYYGDNDKLFMWSPETGERLVLNIWADSFEIIGDGSQLIIKTDSVGDIVVEYDVETNTLLVVS